MEENNILTPQPDPISEEPQLPLNDGAEDILSGEAAEPPVEASPEAPCEETPPPAKKKGGKKLLFAAVAAVAVIAIIVAAAASVFSSSPLNLVAKAAKKTAEELEQTHIVRMRQQMEQGGSLNAALDLAPLTQSLVGYGINGTVNAKLYTADQALALTGSLDIGGVPLADAAITADPHDLTVSVPLLFGDTVYGVDLDRLEKTFDDSVFGPNGPYSLDVTASELKEYLDSLTASRKELSKDAEKVLTELVAAAYQALQDNSTVDKKNSSVTLGGVSYDTTLVTLSMTPTQMLDFTLAVTDLIRNDQALWELLYDTAGSMGTSAIDSLRQRLDEVPAELEALRETAATTEGTFTLSFHIGKSGGCLVGMGVSLTGEDAFSAEVFFGPSPREFRELSFLFRDEYGSYSAFYRVETADANSYKALLSVAEDTETLASGSVSWDKTTGALELFLNADGESASLNGTFFWADTSVTLAADSISYDGTPMELGLVLTLTPGDPMPAVPKYSDVLTMSAEEIGAVVDDISSVLMALLGMGF